MRGVNVPAQGADLWFVIHGDLDQLSKDDVLKDFTTAHGKDTTLHVLTAAELELRKLPEISADDDKRLSAPGETAERFAHCACGS